MSEGRSHSGPNGPKIRYRTKEAAEAACERRRSDGWGPMEPYFCRDRCGWHIGHFEANRAGRKSMAYNQADELLELGVRVVMNLALENLSRPGKRVAALEKRGKRAGTGRESKGRPRPTKRRAAGSPRLAQERSR